MRIRSRRSAPSSKPAARSSARGRPRPAGRHAEVVALDAAGERARGATMYVTLEPCAHWGTTPPCADRIIEAGVARVVIGARDPNPEAAGGVERLRAAGVEVELTDSLRGAPPARGVPHVGRLGRPFVIYKVAMTLDGRVTVPGERWVSGPESRRLVHRAARPGRRGRGRRRDRARRPSRASTRATSRRRRASRGGSSSRAGRCRRGSTARAAHRPAARRAASAGRRRASSRSCSRAARRSRRRSSPRAWSTRCSSSSRPPWRGRGSRRSLRYRRRSRCRT